jgi:hypothetical protein
VDRALEIETFEWVPLAETFRTAENKDVDPWKHSTAADITAESKVTPPEYFYDEKHQHFYVKDGICRTYYLRKIGQTHVLARVVRLHPTSVLQDKAFWESNFMVEDWPTLQATFQKLLQKFLVEASPKSETKLQH